MLLIIHNACYLIIYIMFPLRLLEKGFVLVLGILIATACFSHTNKNNSKIIFTIFSVGVVLYF
jgi:hypothetical protein